MYIEWYFGEDFGLEINEHMQFSLYDKDGNAAHYQATEVITDRKTAFPMDYCRPRAGLGFDGKASIRAQRIQQLKVETPEEKVAKEAVRKAEESLKAAKDTLKAVKGIN